MSEMKTIKFPGDEEPREIVDAKAREELKDKLSNTELTEAINRALARAKEGGEFDGEKGVGISSLEKVATDGNVDTYCVIFTDGTAVNFSVTNGTDGKDGIDGKNGEDGKDGTDGEDGFSPTVKVTQVEGGNEVTITDINGETSFIVPNGPKGENGDNYILTDTDKTEIAEQAVALIDTALADAIGTGVLE